MSWKYISDSSQFCALHTAAVTVATELMSACVFHVAVATAACSTYVQHPPKQSGDRFTLVCHTHALIMCAVCPPGFGRIADEDLPDWWSGRRLLQTPALSSNSSSSVEHAEPEDAHAVSTMGLPTPPPAWATDCLPCPPNFYSPGGAIGFAQCKTCPDGWTTGNASASADCLGAWTLQPLMSQWRLLRKT